jgi:hypothetical protein
MGLVEEDRLRQEKSELKAEVERLRAIVDSPDPKDFFTASNLEAKFQRVLWGDGIDPTAFGRGTDADWVGLVMYLCGGAAKTADSDREKKLHRITAAAAALANWHKMVLEGKVP